MTNPFNRTHLEHGVIALVCMIPFILFGFYPCLTAGVGITCIFFGREYAQAENRGEGNNGMPWEVLQPSRWNIDSYLDFIIPAIVCLIIVLLLL